MGQLTLGRPTVGPRLSSSGAAQREHRVLVKALERLSELEAVINRGEAVLFLWRLAPDWPVDYVSQNVARYGYTAEELRSGQITWHGIMCPEDVERLEIEVRNWLRRKVDDFTRCYRVRTRAGQWRHVEDRIIVVRNARGRISHIQGIVYDVTDRVEAQESARDTEASFRTLVDGAADAIFLVGHDRRILYVNPEGCLLTGYSRKTLEGHDALSLIHPEDVESMLTCLEVGVRGLRESTRRELRLVQPNGNPRPIELVVSPGRWQGLPAVTLMARDISARKRREDEQRSRVARISLLEELSRLMMRGSQDFNHLASTIVSRLTQLLGNAAAISLVSKDGHWLTTVARSVRDAAGEPERACPQERPRPLAIGRLSQVVNLGQPIFIPMGTPSDIEEIVPPGCPLLGAGPVQGLMMVPLRHEGTVLGVLGAARVSGHERYSVDDLSLLQDLADRLALSLVNARYLAEIQRQKMLLEARVEVQTHALQEANARLEQNLAEQKRISEQVKAQEAALRVMLDNMPHPAFLADKDGLIQEANRTFAERVGVTRERLIHSHLLDWMADENRSLRSDLLRLVTQGARPVCFTEKAGGRELRHSLHPVFDEHGEVVRLAGMVLDVTEFREREEELNAARQRLELILNHIPARVFWKNQDLKYQGCNPAFAMDAGLDWPRDVVGLTDADLPWAEQADSIRREELVVLKHGRTRDSITETLRRADGRVVHLQTTKVALRDRAGNITGILGTYQDITELVHLQERLRSLSLTDELTGLPNRRCLMDLAVQHLKVSRRNGRPFGMVFGDLDGLKQINDTWGHAEGDAAICRVARVLRRSVRESDVVARLAGDEFMILLSEVDQEGLGVVLRRIEQNLAEHARAEKLPYPLSMSVGYALFDPASPTTVESLMAEADRQMYQVKLTRSRRLRPSVEGAVARP